MPSDGGRWRRAGRWQLVAAALVSLLVGGMLLQLVLTANQIEQLNSRMNGVQGTLERLSDSQRISEIKLGATPPAQPEKSATPAKPASSAAPPAGAKPAVPAKPANTKPSAEQTAPGGRGRDTGSQGNREKTDAPSGTPPHLVDYCKCSHIRTAKTCTHRAAKICKPSTPITVPPSLNGNVILILGDSLPWQIAQTLQCVAGSNLRVVFKGMHLFPIDEHTFEATLDAMFKAREYAAVVFGIGTWYNWEWGAPLTTPVNASTSNHLLSEKCPPSLRTYLYRTPYRSSTESYPRALRIRKECKLLLGQESFLSGLKLLRRILARRSDEWPAVFWKDVPPQHFDTLSGQYDWMTRSKGSKSCVPIRNLTLAYERNRLADQALSKTSVQFIRTWEHDVPLWNAHCQRGKSKSDCTHYCNPSAVTLNWARATLQAVADAVSKESLTPAKPASAAPPASARPAVPAKPANTKQSAEQTAPEGRSRDTGSQGNREKTDAPSGTPPHLHTYKSPGQLARESAYPLPPLPEETIAEMNPGSKSSDLNSWAGRLAATGQAGPRPPEPDPQPEETPPPPDKPADYESADAPDAKSPWNVVRQLEKKLAEAKKRAAMVSSELGN